MESLLTLNLPCPPVDQLASELEIAMKRDNYSIHLIRYHLSAANADLARELALPIAKHTAKAMKIACEARLDAMGEPVMPKCFRRKPWLGRYSGSKEDWQDAYRAARIHYKAEGKLNPDLAGVAWKAGLIVMSRNSPDDLKLPGKARLMVKRWLDEMSA